MDADEAAAALRALTVPEDVAAAHLARLAAPGAAWASAAPGAAWASAGNVTPLRPRRHAVRATAAGLVFGATLMAGGSVAAASTTEPGDALYGLKTARERVQLTLSRPGDSRARLELKLARTRLAEAASLLRDGKSELAVETLARADAALASAGAHGNDEIDREVAGELDRRVEVLGGLLDGGLPETAADAAREALDRALDRGGRNRAQRPAKETKPGKPAKGGKDVKGGKETPATKPADTPRKPAKKPAKPKPTDVRPTSRPEPRPSSRPSTPADGGGAGKAAPLGPSLGRPFTGQANAR